MVIRSTLHLVLGDVYLGLMCYVGDKTSEQNTKELADPSRPGALLPPSINSPRNKSDNYPSALKSSDVCYANAAIDAHLIHIELANSEPQLLPYMVAVERCGKPPT